MIKSRPLPIFLIFTALFFLAGCGDVEEVKKIDLNKTEEIKDNSRDSLKIRIGLIPEQHIRKMAARYDPLAKYLSGKMGMRVSLVYLDNYGEACGKFIDKQLDAAFFGSFSYALTRVKAGIEPVARPDYGGVSMYRGIVLVKADSGIRNAADMKNKRLALVHRATYAGYLYPLCYFKINGIGDFKTYFSKTLFAGSHDKAIAALLRDEADVAIVKDLVYRRMIKENPGLERELVVLASSEPVPSNALCVGKDMDPSIKARLKEALLALAGDGAARPVLESMGGSSGFVETKDGDYRAVYAAAKVLGIDLNTYPYYDRPDIGFDKAAEK